MTVASARFKGLRRTAKEPVGTGCVLSANMFKSIPEEVWKMALETTTRTRRTPSERHTALLEQADYLESRATKLRARATALREKAGKIYDEAAKITG